MTLESFIFRSLYPARELSAAKLADAWQGALANYKEILEMRRALDSMVIAGQLALSNEGKYRLTELGRRDASESLG
jgi:hypothetical protein